MDPRHIKTVIIGGSNTVMRPGYVSELVKQAAAGGVNIDIVENLAIGATNIFGGLYQLINSQHLATADLLLIEYALNDTPTYAANADMTTHWARAYEGVIRRARLFNPTIRIVSVILENRTQPLKRRMNPINAGVHYLSAYYGTEVVDVAAAVLHSVGPDRAASFEFYKDSAHYKPAAFRQVAGLLLHRLRSDPPPVRPLPAPLDPQHFAQAKTLMEDEISAHSRTFSNSRFSIETAELNGDSFDVNITGKILAILYVAEPNTATARIEVNGEAFACHMMKPGVADGSFGWLLGMTSCEFLYPKDLLKPGGRRTYRIAAGRAGSLPEKIHKPAANMVHEPTDQATLSIAGILYVEG